MLHANKKHDNALLYLLEIYVQKPAVIREKEPP